MRLRSDGSVEFTVRGTYSFRLVACRVAQCFGMTALAWEDGADGYPSWQEDLVLAVGGGRFKINEDWYLNLVVGDDTGAIYRLDYRNRDKHMAVEFMTAEQKDALMALARWLESSFVFGA